MSKQKRIDSEAIESFKLTKAYDLIKEKGLEGEIWVGPWGSKFRNCADEYPKFAHLVKDVLDIGNFAELIARAFNTLGLVKDIIKVEPGFLITSKKKDKEIEKK